MTAFPQAVVKFIKELVEEDLRYGNIKNVVSAISRNHVQHRSRLAIAHYALVSKAKQTF